MYTKVMTVTPEEARLWLDTKNSKNRPISENAVAKYSQEMKQGRWRLNGQPIIFNKTGQLANGQHRLLACVRANTTFETVVTWGMEDEAFETIDDCNTRSMADVLHIRGESSPNLLSAGLRFLWLYVKGEIEHKDLRRGQVCTKPLLQATLEKNPKIRDSVKFYNLLKARPGGLLISAGMAIGLHYLFSLVDEKKADEFFNRFQSGLELTDDNPVYILRNKIIAAQKDTSTMLTNSARYYYMVMTWNAYVKGTYVKRLVFTPENAQIDIEDLPKKVMKDLL